MADQQLLSARLQLLRRLLAYVLIVPVLLGVGLVHVVWMAKGFSQTVKVVNRSGADLRALPMGRGETSEIELAPLFDSVPLLPAYARNSEVSLPAGKTTSFTYDWDDINLCWLLVRSAESAWKVVPSSVKGPSCNLTPTKQGGCCRSQDPNFAFQIDNLAQLPDAPQWLVDEACRIRDGGC